MTQNEIGREGTAEPIADAPGTLEVEEDSVDLLALWHKLWRGRTTIFTITLVVFAFATTIAFLLPFSFTSTTSFIPPSLGSNNSMASVVAGQLSSVGAGELLGGVKTPGDLYAGILRSRSIASELVKRFDLMRVYRVKKVSQAEEIGRAHV